MRPYLHIFKVCFLFYLDRNITKNLDECLYEYDRKGPVYHPKVKRCMNTNLKRYITKPVILHLSSRHTVKFSLRKSRSYVPEHNKDRGVVWGR